MLRLPYQVPAAYTWYIAQAVFEFSYVVILLQLVEVLLTWHSPPFAAAADQQRSDGRGFVRTHKYGFRPCFCFVFGLSVRSTS